MSASTTRKLFVASDAPFKAIIETRTPQQHASDIGLLILDRLERQRPEAWGSISTATLLLLHRLCMIHGEVCTDPPGLTIHEDSIKSIARRMSIAECSAYRPMQALEAAGLIERMRAWGNRRDGYFIRVPDPDPEELRESAASVAEENNDCARAASSAAAQIARAHSDALRCSSAETDRNSLTEPGPARAHSDALRCSSAETEANAGFSTEKPGALLQARARSTIHDDDDISSIMERTGEDPEAVFQILVSIGQGKGPGRQFDAGVARKQSTLISLIDAMALKIMADDSPFLKTPGGWAYSKLKAGEITDDARQRARRKLAPKPPTSAPPPERTAATVSNEDAQIDRIIARLADDELEAMARDVVAKYQDNSIVVKMLTSSRPRECRLMKMEIAGLLAAGTRACNEV